MKKVLIPLSVPYLAKGKEEISSTSVYLYNIIKNLSKYNDIEIIILTNGKKYKEEIEKINNNIKVIFSASRNPLIWLNFLVPYYAFKEKVDIVFFGKSASCFFKLPGKKIITTIHGLIYKILPETSSKIENIYWRLMAKIAYLVSDQIIVVSETDKKDLVDDGCKILKIMNIPIGLDDKYFNNSGINFKVLNDLNLEEKKYFIQIGGISYKKNQIFTLNICKKILLEKKYKLVFIGPILDNEYYDTLNKFIKENNLEKNVVFTGGIDQNIDFKKFFSLLKGSKLFIFPSIYEGFGIPPLEAISQDIPVIVSDKGSLPEVYGKNNVFRLDDKIWEEEINKIISNKEYEYNIIKKQNKILEKYKWKKIIKIYYNLFTKN